MGVFDTVIVACPNCGKIHDFQSKGGYCLLNVYNLEDCPDDVMMDVNRHSPYECSCGVLFEVDEQARQAVKIEFDTNKQGETNG